MDPLSFAVALFNALAALPGIFNFLEQIAAGAMLWYIQNSKNADMSAIADAAALSNRAQTEEDRYAAAEAWRAALGRARVTS